MQSNQYCENYEFLPGHSLILRWFLHGMELNSFTFESCFNGQCDENSKLCAAHSSRRDFVLLTALLECSVICLCMHFMHIGLKNNVPPTLFPSTIFYNE